MRQMTGTIAGTPQAYGAYTYTARVTDDNGATATKTFTLAVTPRADLALALTRTGPFRTGHTAHFRLTITNTGTQATSKTSPTQTRLTVSHGLTHVHGSGHQWQCHKRHHTTSCTRGAPLQPGASTTITITATITARPGTSLTATAKTAPTDTTWHDNTAHITITSTNKPQAISTRS